MKVRIWELQYQQQLEEIEKQYHFDAQLAFLALTYQQKLAEIRRRYPRVSGRSINVDSPGEASTVFDDPLGLTLADQMHSGTEQRFIELGRSQSGRLLVVVYTQRADRVRLISARVATRTEQRHYEELE